MTIDEMAEIMDVLEIAYPAFYARQDESAKLKAMELWATMFADEPAQMVAMAVKAFIASDTKGFPPGIGQIKTIIGKMTMPKELEITELEAWTKVRRAIRGASMADWSRKLGPDGIGPPSAVVAFEALPELLQRLVPSFSVQPADIDESMSPEMTPEQAVCLINCMDISEYFMG